MKRIYLFSIFLLISIMAFGQYNQLPNVTTPAVAGFGRYDNMDVSLFTGQPNISIPLYSIKEGELEVPITMDYHLSTVKPNDRSGWCGIGWKLNAGGYISRSVRGYYDEIMDRAGNSGGFYKNHSKLKDITSQSTITQHKENFMTEAYLGYEDDAFEMSADEFSFNFGKYSGKFYMDENGDWIVVSDDDIKVIFDETTGFRHLADLRPEIITSNWLLKGYNDRFFDVFTLITPDGGKYTFGGKYATEYSIPYYSRNNSSLIATTWYLTKIESPNGYSIDLSYVADLPTCDIKFSAFSSWTSYTNSDDTGFLASNVGDYAVDNRTGKSKLTGYLLFPVYLSSISTPYVTVNLHSGLAKYSEMENVADGFSLNPLIVGIGSLLFWSNDNNVFMRNPFSSNTSNTYAQFFAFYKYDGQADISDETILTNYIKWRVLRAISIVPKNTNYMKTYYFEYNSTRGRRELTKIAERKGSYQILSYYKNNVLFYYTPSAEGYTPKDYQFTYYNTKTFPRYIFSSTDHWGYYNGYTTSTETGERSLSEYINFDQTYYDTRQPASDLDIAQANTLKEIIYPTGGKIELKYRQNSYSKVVPQNPQGELLNETGKAGGLCIAGINYYDSDDNLLKCKKYFYANDIPSYADNYSTSGILKEKKKYVQSYILNDDNVTLKYDIASEGGFLASSANSQDPIVSYSSVIEANYDMQGNLYDYTRYKYTNFDEDIWGEKHRDVVPVYNNELIQGNYSYYTPVSSKSVERGKLIEKDFYNSSRNCVKSIKYKYQKTTDSPLKLLYQQVLSVPFTSTAQTNPYHAYIVYYAPVYTYRYLLQSETETNFDNNGSLLQSNETNYSYNSQNLITAKITKDSKNVEMKTIFQYPIDYSSNSPYSLMLQNHIYTTIIQQMDYRNTALLKTTKNNYKDWGNNLYRPETIQEQLNTQSTPTTMVSFYKYDKYGNPLYYSDKTNLKTACLWNVGGYYPLMKIVNFDWTDNAFQTAFSDDDGFIPGIEEENDINNIENEIINSTLEGADENVRKRLPNSQITSYYYIPTVGIKKIIDPRGVTTYYQYDPFGRLLYIKDKDDNILQSFDYNYKQ